MIENHSLNLYGWRIGSKVSKSDGKPWLIIQVQDLGTREWNTVMALSPDGDIRLGTSYSPDDFQDDELNPKELRART